jgi:hypothetical protein
MIMAMAYKPHVATRTALFGACKIHGYVETVDCITK